MDEKQITHVVFATYFYIWHGEEDKSIFNITLIFFFPQIFIIIFQFIRRDLLQDFLCHLKLDNIFQLAKEKLGYRSIYIKFVLV